MGKSLASLIGVLGSVAMGYQKGVAMNEEREERKKLAAREESEYARKMAKQKEADDLEAGFKATQADQQIEDVQSYDITRMDGGSPEQQEVVAYKANGQVFNDRAAAQEGLAGVNSKEAKAKRGAAFLQSQGQIDQAEKMYAFAKKAFDEGADKVIGGVLGMGPPPEQIKKAGGKVAGTVGEQLANEFNTTGGWKVSKDTMVEYFVDKDAAGREFTNARILGKDGKPVVDDAYNAGRMLMTQKERYELDGKTAKVYQDGLHLTEQNRHNTATEQQAAARDKAAAAASERANNIQQQRVNMERDSYKRQTVDGQLAMIEKTLGKLPDDKREQYALTLYGLSKGKSPELTKMLDELTVDFKQKYQENNPGATPDQVARETAKYRHTQQKMFDAPRENEKVIETVHARMSKVKPGTPEYAEYWSDAQTEAGMTEQQLTAMGFPRPAGMPPKNPVAQVAAGGVPRMSRIPNPPVERLWVGNKYAVNPAYVEWDRQYGKQYRQRNESENKRLIGAYERAPK